MYLSNPNVTCLPGLTSDWPLCWGFTWWYVVKSAYHHSTWPFYHHSNTPDLGLFWCCRTLPFICEATVLPVSSACSRLMACLEQPTIAALWHRINRIGISVFKRKAIKIKSPLLQKHQSATGYHAWQTHSKQDKWQWHTEAKSFMSDQHKHNSDT